MSAPALPKAFVLGEYDDDEAWLEDRRQGIGGSDAPAMLGLSKWTSPVALYLDKIGEGLVVEENEAMRWGTILEQPVREEFSRRTGVPTIGFEKKLIYRSSELAVAQASPDGLAVDDATILTVGTGHPATYVDHPLGDVSGWVEIKTAWRTGEDWTDEDGNPTVPIAYEAQCQWELAVSGLPVCHVAALLPGPRFVTFVVEADPTVQADLFTAAEKFWHLVEIRQMPAMDGSASTTAAIKSAFGNAESESEVELGPDFLALVKRARLLRAAEKEAHEAVAAVENEIKAAMGHHEIALVDGLKVASWPVIPEAVVPSFTRKASRRLTLTKAPKEN